MDSVWGPHGKCAHVWVQQLPFWRAPPYRLGSFYFVSEMFVHMHVCVGGTSPPWRHISMGHWGQ
jgi:hypothetical protein